MCTSNVDVQYLKDSDYEIFNLNCDVDSDFTIQAKVNGFNVVFQLDTGAAITAIPQRFYERHFAEVALKPTITILKGYAGETIEPAGSITVVLKIGHVEKAAGILVVPNGKRPLIGRDLIRKFEIDVQRVINDVQPEDLDLILRKSEDFPELFMDETYLTTTLSKWTTLQLKRQSRKGGNAVADLASHRTS